MLRSTGNINRSYEVLDTIHAMVSLPEKKGCGKEGLPILDAYSRVTDELELIAKSMDADAIISIGYEQRISASNGCMGDSSTNIELYGWATAIKLND